MKIRTILFLSLCLLWIPALLQAANHALVIGNNDYQNIPKLKTAVNDAKDVEQVLRRQYAFKTRLLLNASRSDILNTLNAYRGTLGERDNFLIYYAGHGWLDREADLGYWLPVDAESGNNTEWIPNSIITGTLRAIRLKHVLLVADSCFSGTLARGIDVGIRNADYFSKISRKKSRTVLSSGSIEPVMDSGGGRNSVFAKAFLEALRNNNSQLDGHKLFTDIRRPVMLNSDQTPVYSDIRKSGHEVGGDFVLSKNGASDSTDYSQNVTNSWLKTAGGSFQTESVGKGRLKVTSEPQPAEIYIDDVLSGTSPLQIKLKPGIYTAEARKEGYKPESKRIRLFEDTDLDLNLILEKTGTSLFIGSQPPAAQVYIDRAYSGETPLELKGLNPGTRLTVKIGKEGHQDWSRTITIGSASQELQIELDQKPTKIKVSHLDDTEKVVIDAQTGLMW